MKTRSFPVPANEQARLKALYDYQVLDTFTEKEYDFITRIASQICNTPVALITLLDKKRQWVKSRFGFDITEIPREISFCNYTILDADHVNVVPDLRLDKRYMSNPLVSSEPNAVFYAGAPLVTPEGFVLGSICVLDTQSKTLSQDQQESLKALAKQIITTMELKKKNHDLQQTQDRLQETNRNLKDFARLVSHDVKTPLANITILSRGFRNNYESMLDPESIEHLQLIESSSLELIDFVNRLLKKSETIESGQPRKSINSLLVLKKTIQFVAPPDDIKITIRGSFPDLPIDETALQQVFQNLITNAIKYNDKRKGRIIIQSNRDKKYHFFQVSDNGSGIAKTNLKKIFANQTLSKTDRYGNRGTGMGLATVKSILESVGGNISVDSTPKVGTHFTIAIPLQQNRLTKTG